MYLLNCIDFTQKYQVADLYIISNLDFFLAVRSQTVDCPDFGEQRTVGKSEPKTQHPCTDLKMNKSNVKTQYIRKNVHRVNI